MQRINLVLGNKIQKNIIPVFKDDKYLVELELVGLIVETPIRIADGSSGIETYGMQYFPFISSIMIFNISIVYGNCKAILISLPDSARVIWYRENVLIDNKKIKKIHSQGIENVYIYPVVDSLNLLDGNNYINSQSITIDSIKKMIESNNVILPVQKIDGSIPIRLGAKEQMRYITIPMLYFITSLLTLPLMVDNAKAITAAIVAFWVIMVKSFQSSQPPQARTILTEIYIAYTLLLSIFGIVIIIFSNELKKILKFVGLEKIFNESLKITYDMKGYYLIASVVILVLFFLFILIWMSFYFSRNGYFPYILECFFYKKRKFSDKRNSN